MSKICRFCGSTIADTDHVCPQCKREVVETCAVCGTKLYNNETYCPGCGTPVVVKCSNCGNELYGGERFCPYCGTKNETAYPVAPVPQPVYNFQLPQFGMPYGGFGGYGMPYGGFGGYGMGMNGQFGSPIVLPPITLDGMAQLPDGKPEAITRTRPEPKAATPAPVHTAPAPAPAPAPVPVAVEEPAKPKKCRLGVAGFVLSLLSLIIPILFLFGIPISAVAIKKDKAHKGLAIAGLIIGILSLLVWVAAVIYVFVFEEGITYLEWLAIQIGIMKG